MFVCVCVCVCGRGGVIIQGRLLFEYFHQRGAIYRGTASIRGNYGSPRGSEKKVLGNVVIKLSKFS